MTRYDYFCPQCGYFEAWAGLEDYTIPCQCGETAKRASCSGSPAIIGETVGKATPREVWRG